MLRVFALAGVLLGLAGCAAQRPPARPVAPGIESRGEYGRILALHAVPNGDPRPLRQWMQGLDGGQPAQGLTEYVVHIANGDVIAVVQPSDAGLRPGDMVRILQGGETRIQPMSAAVAVR